MAKWVTVWGGAESPSGRGEQIYAKDLTLRYVIPVMATGKKMRFFFSNAYTDEKVVLDSITVSRSFDRDKAKDFKAITFNGKKKLTLKAFDKIWSDEIDYSVKYGEFIAVNIYFKKLTKLDTGVCHIGKFSYGFKGQGDCTYSEELPFYDMGESSKNYLMFGVDVLTEEDTEAVICFGDSITAQYWPDELTNILLEENKGKYSVVRKAIGGNRILRTYKHWTNIHYGTAGIERVEEDLSVVHGATKMIVLHGINDLLHPEGSKYRPLSDLPTYEQIIEGYRKYIAVAKKHGLKIYFATLTPFGGYKTWDENRNEIHKKVIEWIMTNTEADGFVDFNKVARDDKEPSKYKLGFSNDCIHPTEKGAIELAKEVKKEILDK